MRALIVPIQFACPSCARQYSVKDELAGKSAKCGQCGHKMKIPAATAATASTTNSPKVHAAATQPPAPKSASIKTGIAAPAAAKVTAKAVAKPAPPKVPPADPGMSSWLDEELETARVEAKSKPKPPAPSETGCPSCNGPMTPGSVICLKCGYDTRIRGKRTVERGDEDEPKKMRSMLGGAASLLRGTFFSFLGAMLGAIIWAVLAYATLYEFSIVAWGLGGLAGLGMALGHESDDGTFPGIIAAFMSLLGIVAAKVFIVIIFIAAIVSSAVSEMEIVAEDMAAQSEEMDPIESQRSALALAMTFKEISRQDPEGEFDEAAWEAAMAKSREAVANLTPEEIETRINELGDEHGLDGEIEEAGETELEEDDADENSEQDEDFDEAEVADENPTFGSVVGSLFGPMDGLWILLAFFTAYKVGSGEATD
jgi:hypothetical protein